MEIKNVYDKDTFGGLVTPNMKVDIEEPCLTSTIGISDKNILSLNTVYDNIDYSAIPRGGSTAFTYRYFLSYMGTMGRKQLYSQLLNDETGVLKTSSPPHFKYSHNGLRYENETEPEDVVLSVDFHTGEANILQFKGVPVGGNNPPFQNVYKYSYPFTVNSMPNRSNKTNYFDGWYKQLFVIFRDVLEDAVAIKGKLYGFRGESGLAADNGVFKYKVAGDTTVLMILLEDGTSVDAFEEGDYETTMLSVAELINVDGNSVGIFADTQTLVLKEVNTAIINELKDIALDPMCDDKCSIADWQKLQQKKIGAYIHFTESNFRKAQIILESARQACFNKGKSYC